MTKLDETKLTRQGQISLPKKVRQILHVQLGERVIFFQDNKGRVYLEPSSEFDNFTQEEWKEFLKKTEKEPKTVAHGKAQALRHLDGLMKK